MKASPREPAEVFPVSVFLREEMDARGWSKEDLLNRMPGNRKQNEIWLDLIFAELEFDLETRKAMSIGDASALAHAFGTSKEFWENTDKAYHDYIHGRALP